jgi:hypothetical protein
MMGNTYGPLMVEKTSSKEIDGESVSGLMHSFSLGHAFDYLRSTKCKPWDNRELDVLDGYKVISFILCTISQTAYSLLYTQTVDIFQLLKMLTRIEVTTFISMNLALENFIFVSAFLCAYKCF